MRIWTDKTVDQEFTDLGNAGHTGTLNDRQFSYLNSLGYTGALSDMLYALRYNYVVADLNPALVFDFTRDYYRTNGATDTFAGALTFTRASNATYVDSTGTIQTASTNVARRGHHVYEGGQWVNKGLLLESEARTNLLLNSGTLSTQSATVTADPHTLHFTGTGTVTLSGASTAGPLVGTGTGENNRVSLTFTPTAGSLTLTVSGTVTNAQLEAGSTPSSHIPTSGAQATRAAETLTVAAADLPYSATAMSIQMEGTMTYAQKQTINTVSFVQWQLDVNNRIPIDLDTRSPATGQVRFVQLASGTVDVVTSGITTYSPGINVPFNLASRHGSTFINGAVDGVALTADLTPVALPDLSATNLSLGTAFMGTIKQFRMWDADLGDAGIAEASA